MSGPATAPVELAIDERYVGPPGMGNGGYSAGTFAGLLPGPAAEVTLRRPVPIGSPLRADHDGGGLVVTDPKSDDVVAEVRATDTLAGLEPPGRPTVEQARAASIDSPFLSDDHPFPGCFVCGGEHPDGMRVHPGACDGDPAFCAAVVEPDASLPASGGALTPEIVWAALDCPSFTVEMMGTGSPHVLARLTAELIAPVPANEPAVVVGWSVGREGRKARSASAVLSPEGDLLARASALWIALK